VTKSLVIIIDFDAIATRPMVAAILESNMAATGHLGIQYGCHWLGQFFVNTFEKVMSANRCLNHDDTAYYQKLLLKSASPNRSVR
jgi:hypothetical protein